MPIWGRSSVLIVNLEHISPPCSSISVVNFEHVIAGWETPINRTRRLSNVKTLNHFLSCINLFAVLRFL